MTLNDFLVTFLAGLGLFSLLLLALRLLPDFARNLTILLASLAAIQHFTSPFFTFALIVVTGAVYYGLFWLQWNPRKRTFARAIGAALVVLFFLLKDLPTNVHFFGVALLTLRLLTVTAEVGRGKPLPSDPLEFFVYAFFFPTFFFGPLERLDVFRDNLSDERRPPLTWGETGSQLIRLGVGIGKGWLALRFLPSSLEAVVEGFRSLDPARIYLAALGGYLTLSALYDLIPATAGLAGYRLSENFLTAAFQSAPRRFWRAWFAPIHDFLTENLYLPLGGRTAPLRNTFIVFAVAGLGLRWGYGPLLGAAWNAAVLWTWRRVASAPPKSRAGALVSWLITVHAVVLGWVLFFQ